MLENTDQKSAEYGNFSCSALPFTKMRGVFRTNSFQLFSQKSAVDWVVICLRNIATIDLQTYICF